jgi:carbonic anhydrase
MSMSKILAEVTSANANYVAEFGDKGNLPMPPGRQFAILTCMDARLDPAKYAGLAEGDAHVIRNAGGRASDDAIRSLVISYKLLGTKEWFVIHHTDCGMETFTTETMGELLAGSLKTSNVDATGWHDSNAGGGTTDGKYINWLTISDQEKVSMKTFIAFEVTQWCRVTFQFMVIFMTVKQVILLKCLKQQKLARQVENGHQDWLYKLASLELNHHIVNIYLNYNVPVIQ